MIARHLVKEVEYASPTQVHVITDDGVKLLDTSMDFEGNTFKTAQEIKAWYNEDINKRTS